jgi:uncharacterized membrane protein
MDEAPIESKPAESKLAEPMQRNTLMGILCYIGPLVIVSYIMAKDDAFVKYHVKQGLVLLVLWVVLWLLQSAIYQFYLFYDLLHLGIFILSIFGIVHVVQGKQQELPLVGQFSKYFSF